MNTKETTTRKPEDKAYCDTVVESLGHVPREKIKPSTQQCASTAKLLAMSKEEHAAYSARPFPPDGWKAPHPETCERKMTLDEFIVYEGMRRISKNVLGQSDESSASEDRKGLAIESFTYSPPAPLTQLEKQKLTKIEPITELMEIPPVASRGFFSFLYSLFKPIEKEGQSWAEKSPELVKDFNVKEKK